MVMDEVDPVNTAVSENEWDGGAGIKDESPVGTVDNDFEMGQEVEPQNRVRDIGDNKHKIETIIVKIYLSGGRPIRSNLRPVGCD